MDNPGASSIHVFLPPRRRGVIMHGAAALLLALGGGVIFMLAMEVESGIYFILFLLIALLLLLPVPWVVYRMYSLMRATYSLDRNGLRLHWGLRSEDIPIENVEWIHALSDLALKVPLPAFYFTGIMQGTIEVADLGAVEFLAADGKTLLLVATAEHIFAISPADPAEFLRQFQKAFESGSLTPVQAASIQANNFIAEVWTDNRARTLILTGAVLALLLLALVSLLIPGRASLAIGFDPQVRPLPAVPAERLLLLPVLAFIVYGIDLLAGAVFYRSSSQERLIAYILWSSGILTPILLLAAVGFTIFH